ncbi:hypothetical protein [Synechococcus sp. UW179A]|uniref:hypothetical protein n=1 Tax=Synechococcus sp. UW179A TaxID=2575510 RepID=UPI000E0EB44C|nr:hypothetical protein [Synechococcus sp. UW179A]
MQIARTRPLFSSLLSGLTLAMVLAGTGLMAEAKPFKRQSLMALLEPVAPTPDPVPTLVLERTNRRLQTTGDPIWNLKIEIPGEPMRRFDALSGRANRQNANRDQLGSRAPLPIGNYSVGVVEPLTDGHYPELGPVWISIEPTFTTGRRVLGIHLDPSAGLQNANSGTLGCIGLVNRSDMLELAQLIESSGTKQLVVTD